MALRENLSALRERTFRRLFAGQLASMIGDAMTVVAIPFIVFHLGGDTGDVGLVFAASTLALVMTIFLGGVIADRTSPRRVMIVADAGRAIGQAALAFLLLTDHAQIWQVAVAQVINGAGSGLFMPALTGLVPQSVSPQRLQGANALRGMSFAGAEVIGPAIAGALIAIGGLGSVVVVDAASFVFSAFALWSMNPTPRGAPVERGNRRGVLAEMRDGWDEFRSRRWMWTVVSGFALFNAFVYGPYLVVGASISEQSLGGAGAWATIVASAGVGAIAGGFLALHLQPRHPVWVAIVGLFAFAPVLLLLAATAPVIAIVPAAFLAGGCLGVFDPLWETSVQTQVPPEVLSRVSSFDWFGSLAFTPIGYALAGPYVLLLGKSGALLFGAVVLVLVTLAMLRWGHLREVEHQPGDSGPSTEETLGNLGYEAGGSLPRGRP